MSDVPPPPPPPPPQRHDDEKARRLLDTIAKDIAAAEATAARATGSHVSYTDEGSIGPSEGSDWYDEDGEEEFDSEYDEEEYDDEEYYSEETEYTEDGRAYAMTKPPAVELPNRPLPVEVWKAHHEDDAPPKATKKMKPGEWDALVTRLNDSSRRKQMYLMRAQQRAIATELSGLSFAPRICKKSKELAANQRHLAERASQLMSRKERNMLRVRDERDQAELHDATFKPDLKSPCVCGKGKGMRDSSEAEKKQHTPYCQNFMRACESLNKTSKMQALTDQTRRRVAHLAEYEANKRIRAQQRRQIMEEVEARDLTFAPQVNRRSLKIVERMQRERERKEEEARIDELLMAKGSKKKDNKIEKTIATAAKKLDPSAIPVSIQHKLPGHEEETFKPKINARSRVVRRGDDRSVYNRLYESATKSISARKAVVNDHTRKFINTDIDQEGGIDLGVSFRVDLDIAARPPRPAAAKVSNTSPDYFNVVAYDAKFDWLVRRVRAASEA